MHARTLVILPTYNEKENIERIVSAVLACGDRFHILVVDDHSPDGTGEIVEGLKVQFGDRLHVLHRAGKLGLGTAYVAGFEWGLSKDYQYLMEMDADFSHDPRYLADFAEAAKHSDVVLGSRYVDGRIRVVNWPMQRLLLSYFANLYVRFVTGLPVSDATGGFKCFHRSVLEAIDLQDIRSNGYAFQVEMSYRAWRKGFRIQEIPIVFMDRDQGASKMSKKIVREAVWRVWHLRLLDLLGKLG